MDEGDTATYTVSLTPAGVIPTADLTVNYTTADGTAKAGSDYTAKSSTVTFTSSDATAKTVTVSTTDDTIYEVDENFTFTISNLAGGGPTPTLGTATKTTTITSDDATATSVTLSVSPATLDETAAATDITVTATLDGTRTTATTVTITLSGTAERGAGKDYTATVANVTIPADTFSGTATLSVTPIDDDAAVVVEGAETIIVAGSVTGLTEFPATITLTDTGDTATLTLTLTPETQAENEGGDASFTVTLSEAVSKAVTVAWSATAGTAEADDYSPDFGTVTFAADSEADATETFTITIADDMLSEKAESFTVALGDVTGELVSQVTADTTAVTETIPENDPITVTLTSDGAVTEGDTATYTVSLSPAGVTPTADLTVDYATADGTATSADYTAASGTLTFTPSDATAETVTVQTTQDTFDEGEGETFTFMLSNLAGGGGPTPTLSGSPKTTTITDDDSAATDITLSVSPASLGEADTATDITVTATLEVAGINTLTEDTIVTVTLAGTATQGTDYAATVANVTITAGATSGTAILKVTPTNDAVVEGAETIIVEGSTTVGLSVVSATITLTDNDTAGLTLTPATQNVNEGDNASFTVTLSHEVDAEVSVAWAATAGTAEADDYSPDSGSVTFAANSAAGATQTFIIAITDDMLSETAESFSVALGDVTGELSSQVTADTTAVTETIAESDPITVTLTGPSDVAEGATATYTVSLSPAGVTPTANLTVDYATADGTATSADYTAASGTLTFTQASPGSQTVDVATTQDTFDDDAETFTFTLSNLAGGGGPTPTLSGSPKTTTITDDDAAVTNITLSVSPASLGEADTATDITVTATLAGASTLETDVTITISLAGTAERGAWKDYTATVANVTIPANMPSGTATLSITPINDTVVEGNETIIVEGTTTVGLSVSPATITLIDNDAVVPEPVTVSVKDVSVKEGDSGTTPLTFTVTLDKASDETVTMDWSTVDGTAKSEEGDYVAGSGGLTFSPGDTTKPITVQVNGDTNVEPDENFQLVLKNLVGAEFPDGGRSLIAHGGILNDDETIAPVGTLIWKESGAPVVGQVRTAKWKDQPLDETPSRSRFYWVVCNADGSGCEDVPEYESGPTYEYTPVVDDVGKVLRAHVFYSFEGKLYKAITEFSRLVAPVAIDAPVDTLIWKESGAPVVGQVRTAKWPGQPLDQPPSRSRFYWVVCNADGSGCVDVPEYASGPTYEYTPVVDDVGKVLQAHVFYSFGGKRYKATTTLSQPVEGVGVQ